MITGHSSCDIHKGSGLTAVSCVRRSPSRIWRTKRREQPKAVAISRKLRPSARRRLISSCLSTVSFLRAIQLTRSWCTTTVLDCGVIGPKPVFAVRGWKTTAAVGAGATIGDHPDPNYPAKLTNLCRHRHPLLEPGEIGGGRRPTQKHAAQGRKAAPAGGPNGTKSGGSITPISGGPIPAKSGGSNHSKSCSKTRGRLNYAPPIVEHSVTRAAGSKRQWKPQGCRLQIVQTLSGFSGSPEQILQTASGECCDKQGKRNASGTGLRARNLALKDIPHVFYPSRRAGCELKSTLGVSLGNHGSMMPHRFYAGHRLF